MFGLVLTMGSLPVSIYIASPNVDERAIDIAWSMIVKYFILITTLCFAVFFLNIEKKYLNTFWSLTKRVRIIQWQVSLKEKVMVNKV